LKSICAGQSRAHSTLSMLQATGKAQELLMKQFKTECLERNDHSVRE